MRFSVKALDPAAGLLSLKLEASDEAELRAGLARQGLTALSVEPRRSFFLRRGGRFSLNLFSHELKALLGAGLSVVEALETLLEKSSAGESRRILELVNLRVREGHTLSEAFATAPAVFPDLYVASIRAAERTGALENALGRYLHYQERLDHLREKAISASIYPALLLLAGLGVTIFLLGYVVPRFAGIYQDAGRDIPAASRLLLAWGTGVANHGGWIMTGLGASLALAMAFFSRPAGRQAFGRSLWSLPWLGEQLKVYQLARFYRTTGMLLTGGLPVMAALERAQGVLPAHLAAALGRAREQVASGLPLSVAMQANKLTTPVALRMLRVGEKTGSLDALMERIALFHDDELNRGVERFTRMFEPLLMLFIGLVIGGIVVLMYLPIFELAGSLQ
jgi:general secretion pathway protein F